MWVSWLGGLSSLFFLMVWSRVEGESLSSVTGRALLLCLHHSFVLPLTAVLCWGASLHPTSPPSGPAASLSSLAEHIYRRLSYDYYHLRLSFISFFQFKYPSQWSLFNCHIKSLVALIHLRPYFLFSDSSVCLSFNFFLPPLFFLYSLFSQFLLSVCTFLLFFCLPPPFFLSLSSSTLSLLPSFPPPLSFAFLVSSFSLGLSFPSRSDSWSSQAAGGESRQRSRSVRPPSLSGDTN